MMIPMEKNKRIIFYRENLDKIRKYSAVFAVSDYYAIDFMYFLWENGIRVPENISVAGFDDSPVCEMVYPALTTIRQDGRKRAELAVTMLKKLREDDSVGGTITLPVTLTERQSVRKWKG